MMVCDGDLLTCVITEQMYLQCADTGVWLHFTALEQMLAALRDAFQTTLHSPYPLSPRYLAFWSAFSFILPLSTCTFGWSYLFSLISLLCTVSLSSSGTLLFRHYSLFHFCYYSTFEIFGWLNFVSIKKRPLKFFNIFLFWIFWAGLKSWLDESLEPPWPLPQHNQECISISHKIRYCQSLPLVSLLFAS